MTCSLPATSRRASTAADCSPPPRRPFSVFQGSAHSSRRPLRGCSSARSSLAFWPTGSDGGRSSPGRYTAASVAMACQTTSSSVLLWRFIAGIGIGVEIITIDAYITELVPSWMRGRAFAVNQAVMFTAVPVVAALAWWLVPLSPYGVDGWRWVVLIGAAGSMVIWILRLYVPESPLWLARHGRAEEAAKILTMLEASAGTAYAPPKKTTDVLPARVPAKAGYAELFKPPYLSLVVMFMIFNLCQAFGVYGFANWVPALLVEKGITVTKSLQYSFIIAFAYPIAPLLAASFADKLERKWIICGAAAAIAVFGIAFSQFTEPAFLS